MQVAPGMPVCNFHNPPRNNNGQIAVGTIGGVVYSGEGKPLLLTCYHCINNGHLDWDNFQAGGVNSIAATVINNQPVEIGNIIDARRDERIDIAIIEPAGNIEVDNRIPGIGIPGDNIILDGSPVFVQKFGFTTNNTNGIFAGTVPSAGIFYYPELIKHFFADLLVIRGDRGAFSEKGDSGSFVLDSNKNVVGVLVMGEPAQSYIIDPFYIKSRLSVKFKL